MCPCLAPIAQRIQKKLMATLLSLRVGLAELGLASLAPVTAEPDVTVATMRPVAWNVGGVRVRRDDPGATHPSPASDPGPIPWDPDIARSRCGYYDLLLHGWGCLANHDIS